MSPNVTLPVPSVPEPSNICPVKVISPVTDIPPVTVSNFLLSLKYNSAAPSAVPLNITSLVPAFRT